MSPAWVETNLVINCRTNRTANKNELVEVEFNYVVMFRLRNIMTSNKQSDIWHLLKQKGAQTPTQIGVALGKNYGRASSWACGGLKVLVRTGFVKRLDGGSYEAI